MCNWASIAFDTTDALPFLCLAPVAVLLLGPRVRWNRMRDLPRGISDS